jgi:hypothetical protein
MLKFTFVDIATDKRAFRVTTVIAKDAETARSMLVMGDHWIPQIGHGQSTKSLKPHRKTRLIRDRVEMEKFVNKLGFVVDEVERLIGKAVSNSIEDLIARSSFGTPEVEKLIRDVDQTIVDRILKRADELNQE